MPRRARGSTAPTNGEGGPKLQKAKAKAADPSKSLETWIWDAACAIHGAKDAPKYKDYILPLIFTKRLCDVFDDELDRIAAEVGSRAKAFKLVKADKKLVRFYLPLLPEDPDQPVWSVVRTLSDRIGEQLTTHLRAIAHEVPRLRGIIDRVDFNATTHGQRDLADDRLSDLIERISTKRLGLNDVEADIIGKSYEYLIRKFAEGGGQSAGEFYTPGEVGTIMARVLECEPGMEVYDPCCGSGSLLIRCEVEMEHSVGGPSGPPINCKAEMVHSVGGPPGPPINPDGTGGVPAVSGGQESPPSHAPLHLYGQEYTANTWAMANMNAIIHDMQATFEIGDTFKNPKFRERGRLKTFDRVVANPMWNQDWFTEADYTNDELDRFPTGAGFPGKSSADWGWAQHILASLKPNGRAAVVLDTGAASRGSGNDGNSKEREVRRYFVENDLVESVLYLPDNLFYNTTAPGIVLFLRKAKPKARQGKVLLVNAGQLFEKGKPKNFLAPPHVDRIAEVLCNWEEVEKLSRIVPVEELAKNDYNISPSRYIHTGEAASYRPIPQIVQELEAIEAEAQRTDAELKRILKAIIG
ncbi:MAG: SAM-dependent DNA methyltransferase [Bacteroidetes bacterium]|nr:SAM-dependent DNA methyltransferase [Bacteroidota bacterium]